MAEGIRDGPVGIRLARRLVPPLVKPCPTPGHGDCRGGGWKLMRQAHGAKRGRVVARDLDDAGEAHQVCTRQLLKLLVTHVMSTAAKWGATVPKKLRQTRKYMCLQRAVRSNLLQ